METPSEVEKDERDDLYKVTKESNNLGSKSTGILAFFIFDKEHITLFVLG
jgi:hypothetical protein